MSRGALLTSCLSFSLCIIMLGYYTVPYLLCCYLIKHKLALAGSGCLRGRGGNSKKGTCCMWWGTSVQNVVGHVTAFCPAEGHPRGQFTIFCPMERHIRGHFTMFCSLVRHPKGTLPHFNKWKGILEGTLQGPVHWKSTLEDFSSCYICHRGIQEGTSVTFFLTLGHQRGVMASPSFL